MPHWCREYEGGHEKCILMRNPRREGGANTRGAMMIGEGHHEKCMIMRDA